MGSRSSSEESSNPVAQKESNNDKSLASAAKVMFAESACISQTNQNSEALLKTDVDSTILKFITWNIDGLHKQNLDARTKAVCTIIKNENPDIVFLQEIIPKTAEYISTHLADYNCYFGGETEYFVATLLKKSTVSFSEKKIVRFPNTTMRRNALQINAKFNNHEICLYNTHLESLRQCNRPRKEQLKLMWEIMLSIEENTTVLFGGDLNLENGEVTELGGIPAGIEDLWISCGSSEECEYTWDMTLNDNLDFNGKVKPRCRYDRVYIRHSASRKLKPTYFGLIGLKRLLPNKCFPSDHFGILSNFEII